MRLQLDDLRILLVDDSFEAVRIVRGMLNQLGISKVETASDGVQALGVINGGGGMVDVILCDRNMPNLNGADLLRKIREVDLDIPFIMITGAADLGSVTEAKDLGVTAYIAKPFSLEQLEKKLRFVLKLINRKKPALQVNWR